jgi:membrane protease YdiL (CAAX protease family)
MELKNKSRSARKFGLITIAVLLLQGIIFTSMFHFRIKPQLIFYAAAAFMWLLPFFIAYVIEKRNAESLGFVLKREKYLSYSLYTILGFILITAILGIEFYIRIHFAGEAADRILSYRSNIFLALFIQLVAVGLPEELYFRGYLMKRFCDWLGNIPGLLLIAFIFGMGHTIHRISTLGSGYAFSALIIGIDAIIGGLIFGYQYLKTKSLVPSAITHICLNVFSTQIIALFLR